MPVAAAVLAVTLASLLVSSVAGYGGSLLLVPALTTLVGPREGIALAALLLAWNNVFKVAAYRRTLALRTGWPLVVVTVAGALAGGALVLSLPERAVVWGVLGVTLASLVAELRGRPDGPLRRRSPLALMAASSILSGSTGSSGPLKGLAIRHLGLSRLEHVGLASSVSLAGDAAKAGLFGAAGVLSDVGMPVLLAALPVMPLAARLGLAVNQRIDEGAFRWVFWGVVAGYSLRLAGVYG